MKKLIGALIASTIIGCGALDEAVDYGKAVVSKSIDGVVEIRNIGADKLEEFRDYSVESVDRITVGYHKVVDGGERQYLVLRDGSSEIILHARDLSYAAFLNLKDILTPDDGENGSDGSNGADGADGSDGSNGSDGSDGAQGIAGIDGEDGEDGDKGRRGRRGAAGEDGEDGEACSIDTRNRSYRYSYPSGWYHDVYLVCASEELKLGRFKD